MEMIEQHQQQAVVHQRLSMVHVIPDEKSMAEIPEVISSVSDFMSGQKRASPDDNIFQTFSKASNVARSIGSSILKCESAMINKRLVALQASELGAKAPRTPPSEERACKRRRLSNSSLPVQEEESLENDDVQDDERANEEELLSLERQADRVKRMSDLLKQLESTQKLFLDEMIACAEDYNERRGS